MQTLVVVAISLVAMLVIGCGQGEHPAAVSAPTGSSMTQRADEAVRSAVEQAGSKAEADTATVVVKAEGGVATMAPKTAATATVVIETAGEQAAEARDQVTDMAAAPEKAKRMAAAVAAATTADVVEQAVETVTAPFPSPAADQAAAVAAGANGVAIGAEVIAQDSAVAERVVLDNAKGKVSLPHKQHGDRFGCVVCHGESAPGPLPLDKEAAHGLCKTCHQQQGAGPTQCAGCHEKKAAKAVEGC